MPIADSKPMKTRIALIRGINVGGHNSLPMTELTGILEALGASRVKTYIQSGNVVFQSVDDDPMRFAETLADAIHRRRGFKPWVLVLDAEILARAIAANPYPEAESDPTSLHLGFLAVRPENADLAKMAVLGKAGERFHLGDGVFYLHTPEGVGRSKLAAGAEKLLGAPMTLRNWKTVRKLEALAGT